MSICEWAPIWLKISVLLKSECNHMYIIMKISLHTLGIQGADLIVLYIIVALISLITHVFFITLSRFLPWSWAFYKTFFSLVDHGNRLHSFTTCTHYATLLFMYGFCVSINISINVYFKKKVRWRYLHWVILRLL